MECVKKMTVKNLDKTVEHMRIACELRIRKATLAVSKCENGSCSLTQRLGTSSSLLVMYTVSCATA